MYKQAESGVDIKHSNIQKVVQKYLQLENYYCFEYNTAFYENDTILV